MATVHSSATIRPTKRELLEAELGGPVELLGSYRFDDPAGEVGIEAFIVVHDLRLRPSENGPGAGESVQIEGHLDEAELGPGLVASWVGGRAIVARLQG